MCHITPASFSLVACVCVVGSVAVCVGACVCAYAAPVCGIDIVGSDCVAIVMEKEGGERRVDAGCDGVSGGDCGGDCTSGGESERSARCEPCACGSRCGCCCCCRRCCASSFAARACSLACSVRVSAMSDCSCSMRSARCLRMVDAATKHTATPAKETTRISSARHCSTARISAQTTERDRPAKLARLGRPGRR